MEMDIINLLISYALLYEEINKSCQVWGKAVDYIFG